MGPGRLFIHPHLSPGGGAAGAGPRSGPARAAVLRRARRLQEPAGGRAAAHGHAAGERQAGGRVALLCSRRVCRLAGRQGRWQPRHTSPQRSGYLPPTHPPRSCTTQTTSCAPAAMCRCSTRLSEAWCACRAGPWAGEWAGWSASGWAYLAAALPPPAPPPTTCPPSPPSQVAAFLTPDPQRAQEQLRAQLERADSAIFCGDQQEQGEAGANPGAAVPYRSPDSIHTVRLWAAGWVRGTCRACAAAGGACM